MSRELPICGTCGVQYAGDLPEVCRICADERQYVGWNGQRWTSLDELSSAGHRGVVRRDGELWGVGTEPSFAIGQRALLVPGSGGNVMFDCITYVDDALVAAVREQGGVAAIAISHPHFYGAMLEWSHAFGDVPVYIHEADREWVCRSDGNVVFWSGDSEEILPGRTLVAAGIHFAGGTVLHWADGADGRGVLCSGDIFTVVMDRRWVSFMYSYPNLIPERPEVIERALRLVEPLSFEAIYGAWWGRIVDEDAHGSLVRSAQRYLEHAGHDDRARRLR